MAVDRSSLKSVPPGLALSFQASVAAREDSVVVESRMAGLASVTAQPRAVSSLQSMPIALHETEIGCVGSQCRNRSC